MEQKEGMYSSRYCYITLEVITGRFVVAVIFIR